MGIGAIVTAVSFAAAAAMAAYAIYVGRYGNQEQLDPQKLNDFKPTMAREGAAVPIIYGRVRLAGNIIWWGNLKTEEITQEVESGKGAPNVPEGSQGYRYYVDCWQAICIGKTTIVDYFINDKNENIQATNVLENDGTGDFIPLWLSLLRS